MLQDNQDDGNAEGYCSKCGNALGITGVCYVCAVSENKIDIQELLKRARTCPICLRPKTHHRLHGYICDTPGHDEMARNLPDT